MATFVHFKRIFGHKLDILAKIELFISENMYFNNTNQKVLVLLKNIHIWPCYAQKWRTCPYLDISFLAITQPFLG